MAFPTISRPSANYSPLSTPANTTSQSTPPPPDLSKKLPPLADLLAASRLRREQQQQTQQQKESTSPKIKHEHALGPPPETPPLPPPLNASQLSEITFCEPAPRILSSRDHELFMSSATYGTILGFIFGIADSVRGTPCGKGRIASTEEHPEIIQNILGLIDQVIDVVKYFPPYEASGSRFGNAAFQDLYTEVQNSLPRWHEDRLGIKHMTHEQNACANTELSTYLLNSLGNWLRLDYGSGHELNFAIWLLCLNRLSLLPPSTFPSIATVVFPRYIELARTIQTTYYLEPAGSHGVWGLDDFQFLPFLFGAAQLSGHPHLRPKSIHNAEVLEHYKDQYIYFEQVAWVNASKNVEGLRWHSPMLDDISAAKSWAKVDSGMRKMFVKEVLGKMPVMQHFLFGGLVPAVEGMTDDRRVEKGGDEAHEHGHGHAHGNAEVDAGGRDAQSWSDCCGIKVPSSLGANAEERKRQQQEGTGALRRIPFD